MRGPSRLQPIGKGQALIARNADQSGHSAPPSKFQQQALCRVARPPSALGNGLNRVLEESKLRVRALRALQTIDPPLCLAGTQIKPPGGVGRNPLGMLEHQTIKIHHIQSSVRPFSHHHGARPGIAAGPKLPLRL